MTDTDKLRKMAEQLRKVAGKCLNDSLSFYKWSCQLDVYADHAQEEDKAGLVKKALEQCPEVFGDN